jgi:hypothetical protein
MLSNKYIKNKTIKIWGATGNEERERSNLLSHMVGKCEETTITGYLLDLGISRFTHGEKEPSSK